ncbi:TRAP transporter small permease [Halalkalibacter krulwichiae]|uniref:2,3-diketo-L-gulonate TRAP transporter small permease protein YiaM n=1 Tax=Halalkalibacter krulwichiae TaxID=199441 RepID=A0A1X9MDP0_9BACI|nr:TRAP transporter small permease [Halalkalibacter krulwichiae]ARK28552.1 2,3-diketo-L-gulonate TRAP transporter small permease protein YiaM [Halalkalibacter krulwichiae]
MNKLKVVLDKTLITSASLLLILMVIFSVWQVLARYVFNISSPGTEESIRYLLIWFGLLTAAYVFGAKKHIAILFFREKFSPRTQLLIERVTDVLIILLAAILMVFGGIKIVLLTSAQTAAATGISLGVVYAALPVSGVFIIIYTVISMMTKRINENEEVGV